MKSVHFIPSIEVHRSFESHVQPYVPFPNQFVSRVFRSFLGGFIQVEGFRQDRLLFEEFLNRSLYLIVAIFLYLFEKDICWTFCVNSIVKIPPMFWNFGQLTSGKKKENGWISRREKRGNTWRYIQKLWQFGFPHLGSTFREFQYIPVSSYWKDGMFQVQTFWFSCFKGNPRCLNQLDLRDARTLS